MHSEEGPSVAVTKTTLRTESTDVLISAPDLSSFEILAIILLPTGPYGDRQIEARRHQQ